jgi:hypothetical protein
MPEEIGFPIEASLMPDRPAIPTPEAPVRPAPSPKPVPEPARNPTPPPPPPAPEPPAYTPPVEPVATLAPEPPRPVESVVPQPPPAVEAKVEAKPVPARPARPALRVLPGRVELRYAVQYGEGGFTAGEARYIWQSRNGRYSLVSTMEVKGLASLFVSGRIVQVSEGEVNEGGLAPGQYWLQQGERRRDNARFLWDQNQVVLGNDRGGIPLTPQAQDLLSFPFQLAMTVRSGEPAFNLGISNGRKFQEYRFQIVGEEHLELPGGHAVEAMHLQGGREGSGVLDVWLDRNAMFLPVQVRTLDQKGKQVTLIAEEVTVK